MYRRPCHRRGRGDLSKKLRSKGWLWQPPLGWAADFEYIRIGRVGYGLMKPSRMLLNFWHLQLEVICGWVSSVNVSTLKVE